MKENKIYVVGDVHCRSFYKPVLNIKDKPVIFLGDYMDPYYWEGFSDEEGIANLEEIFEFARKNKNVILLIGNHDASYIWSFMGFERTSREFYSELHRLYRDNIDLLHSVYQINDTVFSHSTINSGWINCLNGTFKHEGKDFQLTKDNILSYIENEFQLELQNDKAPNQHFWGGSLNSPIFWIGRSRGGDAAYGSSLWSDFYDDYWNRPFDWNLYQVTGHQQQERTGSTFSKDGAVCIDSRAIFEYNLDTHFIKPSDLNDEKTKAEISKESWKGTTIRFRPDIKKGE